VAEQGEHGITWTDATWNPIRGCSRVSEGCRNCYAERVAYRFSGPGGPFEGLVRVNAAGKRQPQWNGTVRVVEEHMLDPLKWKRPRRIFVNSMSDLFHENLADDTIDRVFAVMALCPQHSFQVLTKRPERMLAYLKQAFSEQQMQRWVDAARRDAIVNLSPRDEAALVDLEWPLPNVWLGVSVEDQKTADERIPLLLQTPAAVRWISAEPLLGPIDLEELPSFSGIGRYLDSLSNAGAEDADIPSKLDWVVVGGESGSGARPMHPDWARSLRDQCVAAGVAFHFKQWGEWLPAMCDGAPGDFQHITSNEPSLVGKRKAGRLLDGRTWDEYPAVHL
jgi:protein gp37